MLIDQLQEELKNIEPNIHTIKSFWTNSAQENLFTSLYEKTHHPDFWQNPDHAQISKDFQHIKTQREEYTAIINGFTELTELIEMFKDDPEELEKLKPELFALRKRVEKFKLNLLLNEEQDQANCFLNINAGAGGTESQDWAEMLLRMYLRFCEREKFTAEIVDYQAGEGAGIRSATLYIKGRNAYGLLKSEHGIHRLVRISPFDANKRRHTSFAAISLLAEAENIELSIDPKDLRIDTYRAGGAGGQHVNKTESAVRITHLPTNIVVQCQNERSQLQNRETAMKMLMAKLVQKQKEEVAAKASKIEKRKIEWGSQIRSYILHPYKMVKDHRTDTESPQPELVLDGDLIEFIQNYLIWLGSEAQ